MFAALRVVLNADLVYPEHRPATTPYHEAAKLAILLRHPKLAAPLVLREPRSREETDLLVVPTREREDVFEVIGHPCMRSCSSESSFCHPADRHDSGCRYHLFATVQTSTNYRANRDSDDEVFV